ncbi:hypothetical protein HHI36_003426 [Cryptolaemus montrouzieri]|uniref:RING-CH-type domain-containing protein n=1 Tax=Cryptolaemus montrouzieri TaxID=559131 RepID=A0ABD2PDV0_9CUCU
MSKNEKDTYELVQLSSEKDESKQSSSHEEISCSTSSVESLKFPFDLPSHSKTEINSNGTYSSSESTDGLSKSHYIFKVQPQTVPYLDGAIESENVSPILKIKNNNTNINECSGCQETKDMKNISPTNSIAEKYLLQIVSSLSKEKNVIDSKLGVESTIKLTKKYSTDSTGVEKNLQKKSSQHFFIGPRLISSDSELSVNRKYFQKAGKNFIPIFENVCSDKTKVNPNDPSKKPFQQIKLDIPISVENIKVDGKEKPNESPLSPTSLFENDNYKSFSDSNSPEDDIVESIKSVNSRLKSPKRGDFEKIDLKRSMELKNSSLISIPSTVCRICHTNTANERLLSPCYCKGSLAYVHLSCLERWLNQSSRSYCELCLYQYNAVETLRYGFLEGIRLWVRHPRNRNHVRSDCLIAFLLTIVTLGLVVICLIGMDYFLIEGIKLGLSKMWTKSFIVSFLGVVMMGYIVTMYLIVKDQFVPWYNWWKNTLNIRLLLNPAAMQMQRL